jgi:hypothetical protein
MIIDVFYKASCMCLCTLRYKLFDCDFKSFFDSRYGCFVVLLEFLFIHYG